MRKRDNPRTSTQRQASATTRETPLRDGDHGLGIPGLGTPPASDPEQSPSPEHPSGADGKTPLRKDDRGSGSPIPETPPVSNPEHRPSSRHPSVETESQPMRDDDSGLGRPPSSPGPGRVLSKPEVEKHDRQAKEREREELQQELEQILRQGEGRFQLPAPILGFLSWVLLAAASVLGLLLIGQGAAAVGHIQALPTPFNWIAGVVAGACSLVLVALIVRLGWALGRLRRSPAVNLSGFRALNERQHLQRLALLHAGQARESLRQYLDDYDGEAARPHLNEDERSRLDSAQQYLLADSQTLSASEWLDAFSERYQSILDAAAARRVRAHAVRVGLGTALSRFALIDQAIVLATCMAMLRELMALYGLRPSVFQSALLLARSVMVTYLSGVLQDATDGMLESDSFQDVMQDLTEGIGDGEGVAAFASGAGSLSSGIPGVGKLFDRLTEGTVNAALVWRLGSGAIKQIQPVRSKR